MTTIRTIGGATVQRGTPREPRVEWDPASACFRAIERDPAPTVPTGDTLTRMLAQALGAPRTRVIDHARIPAHLRDYV